jgi:spore maturation protein CgeB
MKIIKSRTSNRLSRPLRILSILRGRWDGQRFPALQALADIGHEVVYVDQILNLDGYRKLVRKIKFDVAVLWGSSLVNLLQTFPETFFLEEEGVPYVSLWTDNSIKHQVFLKEINTPLHKAMFVPDTLVIQQLKKLGWNRVFYMPPWHIDSNIFRPVNPVSELVCDISFAATMNSYLAERSKWRANWTPNMHQKADVVIQQCRETRDYADVFDLISNELDAGSIEFNKLSHALYFEQKALAREQLIHSIGGQEIHIVGIGTATTNRSNVIMHKGRDWHNLSPLFCSSNINLNLTPWPKSCHHRIFQIAASGGFVMTDWREDAVNLFEPDHEVVYFKSLSELPDLIDRFKNMPEERARIANAGRRRFLNQHTAAHRMEELSVKLYEIL